MASLTAVVALCVATGCGPLGTDGAGGRGFDDDERAWVADTLNWWRQLGGDLVFLQRIDAFDERQRARLARIRARLSSCDEQVPSAPTPKLVPAERDRRALCGRLRGIAATLGEIVREGPSSTGIADLGVSTSATFAAFSRSRAALDALSLSRRALDVRHGGSGESHVDPVLSAVAERVADGRSAEVRCWSRGDWPAVIEDEGVLTDGYISIDSTGAFATIETATLHLQDADCAKLVALKAGDGDDDRKALAWANGVLSHEIQHLVAPGGSEAETECAALQHAAAVAIELGADPDLAAELARIQWQDHYPDLTDTYRSVECRPGGALDLHPETDAWPTG